MQLKMNFIILFFILTFSVNAFGSNSDLKIIINDLNEKKIDDITIIKKLKNFIPENNILAFKKAYLLSLLFYSDEPNEMKNTVHYLLKAKEQLLKSTIPDTLELIEFITELRQVYNERFYYVVDGIVQYNYYTYEDLRDVIGLVMEQFSVKIDICEILNSYRIASNMKKELVSFKNNILKNRKNKEMKHFFDRLEKIMCTKVSIPNTKRYGD